MLYQMVFDKRVERTRYSVRRLVSLVEEWKISDCGKDECVIEYVQIRFVEERRYSIILLLYSISNKMDNSLLAVRDINHKYIAVEESGWV